MIKHIRLNGKVYPVIFDLNAMEVIEEETGKEVSEALAEIKSGKIATIKKVVYAVFKAGAWAKASEFETNAHTLFSWFDLEGKKLQELFSLVLPEDEKEGQKKTQAEQPHENGE